MFIVFGRDISLILRTREISLHKNNSHDLHRMITHSLVLVIISYKKNKIDLQMEEFISTRNNKYPTYMSENMGYYT